MRDIDRGGQRQGWEVPLNELRGWQHHVDFKHRTRIGAGNFPTYAEPGYQVRQGWGNKLQCRAAFQVINQGIVYQINIYKCVPNFTGSLI